MNDTTIAFVCPWYGDDIPGGAERAVRELVQNLAKREISVHVLTTCARDFCNWEQYYEPGIDVARDEVCIHRFLQNKRNSHEFNRVNRLILGGQHISVWDETVFLENIIRSDELCRYIWRKRRNYVFVFTPYMFGTTYWCSQIVPARSFIIPCLHDDGFAAQLLLEVTWRVHRHDFAMVDNGDAITELVRLVHVMRR